MIKSEQLLPHAGIVLRIAALLVCAGFLLPGGTAAQAYPAKPVRMIQAPEQFSAQLRRSFEISERMTRAAKLEPE